MQQARPARIPATVLTGPRQPQNRTLRRLRCLGSSGGVARWALDILRHAADRHRLLLLAPKSTTATWDVIADGYGPDVRNLDRLLAEVATAYPLREYTIGGFSDGASYALSLGLTNGDVFDSVIAFSPGFQAAESATGRPRVFISHGTEDRVLPIDRCSRRIVASLEKTGHPITYHEFDGGHAIPGAVQVEAAQWLDAHEPSHP